MDCIIERALKRDTASSLRGAEGMAVGLWFGRGRHGRGQGIGGAREGGEGIRRDAGTIVGG